MFRGGNYLQTGKFPLLTSEKGIFCSNYIWCGCRELQVMVNNQNYSSYPRLGGEIEYQVRSGLANIKQNIKRSDVGNFWGAGASTNKMLKWCWRLLKISIWQWRRRKINMDLTHLVFQNKLGYLFKFWINVIFWSLFGGNVSN